MKIIEMLDGSFCTVELSRDDAHQLALMARVAVEGAYGGDGGLGSAGLGESDADRWATTFSLYHSFFEALTLTMVCKGYLPYDQLPYYDVATLRQAAIPPVCEW